MTTPTADDVAWAVVAAARETGESAFDCIERTMGMRCRHYAAHALRKVFPELPTESAARLVGCPGKPEYFWNNSKSQVTRLLTDKERAFILQYGQPDRLRASKWWSEEAFARVVAAIQRSAAPPIPPSQEAARLRARDLVPVNSRRIITRIQPRAVADCQDVTADFMGDPPRSRSALAERPDEEPA